MKIILSRENRLELLKRWREELIESKQDSITVNYPGDESSFVYFLIDLDIAINNLEEAMLFETLCDMVKYRHSGGVCFNAGEHGVSEYNNHIVYVVGNVLLFNVIHIKEDCETYSYKMCIEDGKYKKYKYMDNNSWIFQWDTDVKMLRDLINCVSSL